MQLSNEDVKKLDAIIDVIVDIDYQEFLRCNDTLKEIIGIDYGTSEKEAEREFTRLAKILSYFGVVKHVTSKYDYDSIEKNEETRKFKERGGFKAKYDKQLEKNKEEQDFKELQIKQIQSIIDANEFNVKNAEKNRKNERINKIEKWINIILGVINISLLTFQILRTLI